MKTQIKLLILPLFFALLFSSCIFDEFVVGNGEISEETRTVPDFTSINSAGSFDVYYEYADEIEVIVSCESNLIPYIETVVYNSELKVRTPYNVNIRATETIEIYIKGPSVDEIKLSGSGLIHTEAINADYLKLSTSGSGHIETTFYGNELITSLSGSGVIDIYAESEYVEASISGSGEVNVEGFTNNALFKISGSGTFNGYDFPINNLEVNISGSGDLFVNVNDILDIDISGSGDIHYIGNPIISSNTPGSGNFFNEN
ncbi:MAG: DUF2807 domain-containing protein [Prolixibacteraceae bacterium]|jgi:hypothetical protein|nr:DUF2807 domain-containing protein [Prolixibacteraceae bacterium]